jgi:hypothetical protein
MTEHPPDYVKCPDGYLYVGNIPLTTEPGLLLTQWHAAEMEVSRLKDAMTQVLRLQSGVSPKAKMIIREALAASR